MQSSPKTAFSPMVWVWLACVGVASFLTWGTLSPTSFSGLPAGFPSDLAGGFFGGISINVNAWSGNLTLAGLQLPNWLVVVAAAGAVAAAYARSTGAQLPRVLPLALLVYALAHVLMFGLIVAGSGRGSLGVGIIAMFLALAALLRAIRARPNAEAAADSSVPIL